REPMGIDDFRDAGLDERPSAARTRRPGHVRDAPFERDPDARRVHDRVLFGVTDQWIFRLAIAQADLVVRDPAREPIEARATNLAIRSDHDAPDLRRGILAPTGDVPRQPEEPSIPFLAHAATMTQASAPRGLVAITTRVIERGAPPAAGPRRRPRAASRSRARPRPASPPRARSPLGACRTPRSSTRSARSCGLRRRGGAPAPAPRRTRSP